MSKKGLTDALFQKVREDIYKGLSQSDLIDRIINNFYELKYEKTPNIHYARNIISDVRKKIKEEWKEQNQELKELQLGRLLDLYNESRKNNDRMNALNTLKEINKVGNIYEAEKVDMTINADIQIDFGFDDE